MSDFRRVHADDTQSSVAGKTWRDRNDIHGRIGFLVVDERMEIGSAKENRIVVAVAVSPTLRVCSCPTFTAFAVDPAAALLAFGVTAGFAAVAFFIFVPVDGMETSFEPDIDGRISNLPRSINLVNFCDRRKRNPQRKTRKKSAAPSAFAFR